MRLALALAAGLVAFLPLGVHAKAPAARFGPPRASHVVTFETPGDTLGAEWSRRRIPASGAARLDRTRAHGGRKSLRLTQTAPNEWLSVDRVYGPEAFRGAAAVRLRGWIRTENVATAGAVPGIAGLRLMVIDAYTAAYDRLSPAEKAAERPRRAPLFENMSGTSDLIGPGGTTPWRRFEIVLPVPPGATEVRVGANLAGTGTAWFDDLRLDVLPASSLPRASSEARPYATVALDTMQAHALRRREIDWAAFRAFTLGALFGARTPRETYPALRWAVKLLDSHGDLFPREWVRQNDGAASEDPLPPPRPIGAARLGPDVGYVAVPGYIGAEAGRMRRFAEAIRTALDTLEAGGACRFVVDLRGNDGGAMGPMIAGLAPLATPDAGLDTLGYFVDADGRAMQAWGYDATTGTMAPIWMGTGPHDTTLHIATPLRARLRRPGAPVAVLFGPQTGSSGEFTLLSFVGRPHVRTFGQPSGGYASGNGFYLLADSAALNLTTSLGADHRRRVVRGRIVPDEPVAPGPPGAPLDADPVVLAARRWLATQPCPAAAPGER